MRLFHFSDPHGNIPRPLGNRNNFDTALCTGDLLPDPPSMPHSPVRFSEWQKEWVKSHLEDFRILLQGRTLLFVLGNHDWIPAEELEIFLQAAGISAISLHDKVVQYQEVSFYGFPYVNPINGEYNYETKLTDMHMRIEEMVKAMNDTYVDVIAAHSMPQGVLDLSYSDNMRIGIDPMTVALSYKIKPEMLPQLYCGGHTHSPALTMKGGILFSNAATSSHLLEIV